MMTDVREMTVADYERVFCEARVEDVINIMQAIKSVTRDRTNSDSNVEENKEFIGTLDQCILKLDSFAKRNYNTL